MNIPTRFSRSSVTARPRRIGFRHLGARQASGFSLIEVLIALLVLAFGLLGLAFLQVLNVRYTQSAQHRTVATNLATELLDMMRSNHIVYRQYLDINNMDFDRPGAGGCDRSGALDYTANMQRWACEVAANLPGGTGSVQMTPAGVVTVTLQWTDDVGREDDALDSAPKTTSFAVTSRL